MTNIIDITTRLSDDTTLIDMHAEIKRHSSRKQQQRQKPELSKPPAGCKRWYHDSNPSVWLPLDDGPSAA